jgi:putative transposase
MRPRFRKHTNHRIANEIVAIAERLSAGIALEDLTDIRKRTKARKAQRYRLAGWSFARLRQFTDTRRSGKESRLVADNPRDTSSKVTGVWSDKFSQDKILLHRMRL